MLLPSTKTKNILFFASLLAVVALILYFGGIYFLANQRTAIVERAVELKSEDLTSQNLDRVGTLMEETAAERSLFDTLFIQPDGVIGFLNSIESWAVENNVELELSISEERPYSEGDNISVISLSTAASGSWSEVFGFYNGLVSLPVDISIERLEFSRESATATEGEAATLPDVWVGSATLEVLRRDYDE